MPERTVRAVRELAATDGLASAQDGVIELAVDELARRIGEEAEAGQWEATAADSAVRAAPGDLAAACEQARYPGDAAIPVGVAGQTCPGVIRCQQLRTISLERVAGPRMVA